ncbi:gfo/Idh/MocA family oxidoreductase [Cohnella endophytica]|uniref:Gfo/Idh/MocA family oxidoreductase n=1 Tax=Cohnella endophytica TaxID=2419778 RepID=A0A494XF44_9BACL|nr:Gfo/Idh/MocA family oxidoreductase [Cohnella endophytica]RKP46714.1 gfo/Idh/MocA family oxidoreductase [Cohnella endophytica]
MSMKMIQVGLGAHGRGVGSNFVIPSPYFEYAGLVDLDLAVLEAYAEQFRLSKQLLFTDYKQAFQLTNADAVFISAISPVHYEIAKEALEQNLHVLIEKPFVLTMGEAEELVQLAAEKKRSLMISQNYRFASIVVTLKQALQHSALGEIQFISAEFYCDHDGKRYQREMDNYILLEMSVHHIDMIRFLLDSNILNVSGRTWNYPDSGYKSDPNVNAVYYTGIGVPVFYTASLLAKGASTPWEGKWRIQCREGSIHLDDLGEGYGVYVVPHNQSIIKKPLYVPQEDNIHGVLAEFARSIREGSEAATSGRDNLNTLEALLATSESSREGKEIRLSNI